MVMALFDQLYDENLDDTTLLLADIEATENLKGYTEYIIRVQRGYGSGAQTWVVKHRYKDFVQLDNALSVSGLNLPMPPKKFLGNKQKEFIAKRIQDLQTYLNILLSHQLLASSVIVKRFLDPKRYWVDFQARAFQTLSVCLRSVQMWSVTEPWRDAGWRIRKHFFAVKYKDNPKIRQLLSWSSFGPDWCGDVKDTLILLEFLRKIESPFFLSPTFCCCNEDGTLTIRPLLVDGTLRDQMTKAKPSDHVLKKYCNPKTVFPLDFDDIRHIGLHILEGLRLLHKLGVPYGHLHCGNLTISDMGCTQLLDIEDGILGLPSFYRPLFVQLKAVSTVEEMDVYCFGQTLYEMAVGEPLNAPTLLPEALPLDCPRPLHPLLHSILSMEACTSNMPTIEELLENELFRGLPCLEGPKELRISGKIKEILQRCSKRIETRLSQERAEFRRVVKSKRVTAFVNSEEQKRERRKLMKQWTSEGSWPSAGVTACGEREKADEVDGHEHTNTNNEAISNQNNANKDLVPAVKCANVAAVPPPPPAPPPPMLADVNVHVSSDKSAVLESIRCFQKTNLKKVETKDASAPKI